MYRDLRPPCVCTRFKPVIVPYGYAELPHLQRYRRDAPPVKAVVAREYKPFPVYLIKAPEFCYLLHLLCCFGFILAYLCRIGFNCWTDPGFDRYTYPKCADTLIRDMNHTKLSMSSSRTLSRPSRFRRTQALQERILHPAKSLCRKQRSRRG